jgi:hypothetical protein
LVVKQGSQDEQFLLNEGNRIIQTLRPGVSFVDKDFDKRKALGNEARKYEWSRVKDIDLD